MKNVFELENKHKGKDIWIVAAGPTMNYVHKDFFENKISIGVNQVYKKFKTTYLLRKEEAFIEEASLQGIPLIISRYKSSAITLGKNPEVGDYVFDHKGFTKGCGDTSVISKNSKLIVISNSTITSAMHVGAIMGASNLIICGHDCGTLDDESRFKGYNEAIMGDEAYREWLKIIQKESIAVREKLSQVYGCHMYSLSPFIGLNMEGHVISC